MITRALSEAVRLYSLQCRDFLAIIDGIEMDAQADIRAPTLIELDWYCERVAVAVGRLPVRIFGEETPAGERVAAELGRALQLTTWRNRPFPMSVVTWPCSPKSTIRRPWRPLQLALAGQCVRQL